MSRSLSLTRLELKRQRESLARYERFLPALKRKQQQLQVALHHLDVQRRALERRLDAAEDDFAHFASVMGDVAGVDLSSLAVPTRVITRDDNVAGVALPEFVDVEFPEARYSLFATPPWVDGTLESLRALAHLRSHLDVVGQRRARLSRELTRVLQRVNLFEKVKIPTAAAAIRRIRIHLGDEMSAAVGRAKLAKGRITGGDTGGTS